MTIDFDRKPLAALGLLATASAAGALASSALANPPGRVAAFRNLPDWTGIWVADVGAADAGGQYKDLALFTLVMGHPPYNAKWEADFQARIRAAQTRTLKSCAIDFPSLMQYPQPFELTVTPEETLMTAADGAERHIYTDGRAHTPVDILIPSHMGDSIGRWEGPILVVDTIARRAGPLLFGSPVSFSASAHFLERIRQTGPDSLEDLITIEDPGAFTRPWRLTFTYRRATFVDRLVPYECDDDRIRIVDGKGEIAPP